MDIIRCPVSAGVNFRRTKLSRMAVEPWKLRKFSTAKIKVHTVHHVLCIISVAVSVACIGNTHMNVFIALSMAMQTTSKMLSSKPTKKKQLYSKCQPMSALLQAKSISDVLMIARAKVCTSASGL